MADYLDEDPVMTSQKYAILSYVLTDKSPMIKFRGAFSSMEECQNKIKRLQAIDSYFHMFVIDVGKWGALLTDEELKKSQIDEEYQSSDSRLNDMMKSYKEERDKAKDAFEQRKREMAQRATQEGTKEGQQLLASEKEHPSSVKKRLEDTAEVLEKIKKDLDEFTTVYENTKRIYETYTEEELRKAEEDIKNLKIE